MGPFAGGVAAGAASGMLANRLEEFYKRVVKGADTWEDFIETLPQSWKELHEDIHALRLQGQDKFFQDPVPLFPYPGEYSLFHRGFAHISIFTTTATPLRAFISGVGQYLFTSNAGWNALDFPDNSTLSLPQAASGTSIILVYCSDTSLGSGV